MPAGQEVDLEAEAIISAAAQHGLDVPPPGAPPEEREARASRLYEVAQDIHKSARSHGRDAVREALKADDVGMRTALAILAAAGEEVPDYAEPPEQELEPDDGLLPFERAALQYGTTF